MGGRRWPSCSTAAASSSSTISCSPLNGTTAARTARSGPTTSMERVHLPARDVALSSSLGPRWRSSPPTSERMGWRFVWVSSGRRTSTTTTASRSLPGTTTRPCFNFGTRARECRTAKAQRLLQRRGGHIFHTYSTYGRGIDTAQHRLQLPRPRPARARRGRQAEPVVGPSARRVRPLRRLGGERASGLARGEPSPAAHPSLKRSGSSDTGVTKSAGNPRTPVRGRSTRRDTGAPCSWLLT